MRVTHISDTLNTSTGSQDITGDLNGETPKAGILFSSNQTGAGTDNGASVTIGIFTASDVFTVTNRSANNVDPTACKKSAENGRFDIFGSTSWNPDISFTLTEFIADGIRINITNAGSAVYLSGVLFSGNELEVASGIASINGENDTTTVTTGFAINSGFFLSPGREFLNRSVHVANMGIGFYGSASRSYSKWDDSREATSQLAAALVSRVMGQNSTGAINYTVKLENVTSNSFDLTVLDGDANDELAYLALSHNATVTTIDTATTATAAAINVGVLPQCVISVPNTLQAESTNTTNFEAGSFGLGVTVGTSAESCVSIASEDGASRSDTERTFQDHIRINQDDGTSGIVAKFVSFSSTGWTWNYSATLGTATKWPVLVFHDEQSDTPAPGADALRIVGYVPFVASGPASRPGEDALALSGYVPVIVAGDSALPSEKTLIISGHTPDVTFLQRVSYVKIKRHSLFFSGAVPTVDTRGWVERVDNENPIWVPLDDRSEVDKFFK